jgi:DegV family protein with EDD domain
MYRIFTDSSCDMPSGVAAECGVQVIQLEILIDGEENRKNNEIDSAEFYQKLRDGKMARTSAANIATFKDAFIPVLDAGDDVLYLGFSSGLSTTFQSAQIAATELEEMYPERKIITVDTLAASLGQGLLVYLAVQKQKDGETIEQVADYVRKMQGNLAHWFTVDDLNFLKRGGRISGAVALVGTVLGIKPVLHVDDEGHLINVTKVRGRTAAIQMLADKYGETVLDKTAPVWISHGDCLEDAEKLADILKKQYGVQVGLIGYVGPVIGAHSGPGTLALFFVGKEK